METININLILIIVIILLPIILIRFLVRINQKTVSVIVVEKIRKINELASHEINYTGNISKSKTIDILMKKFSLTKSFFVTTVGKMKIGINLEHIKVYKLGNKISITIPEIKIISHEIEILDVVHQTKNPLFHIDLNDFKDCLNESKIEKEREILNSKDDIQKAYEELKERITELLNLGKSKKLKINFDTKIPLLLPLTEEPDTKAEEGNNQ